MPCDTCAELGARAYGYTKGGRPEDDIALPPAAAKLRDFGRDRDFRECPTCGDLFSYKSTHDYFVNGDEDDETLTRLAPDQAAEVRARTPT